MFSLRTFLALTVFTIAYSPFALAAPPKEATLSTSKTRVIGSLDWHTDYAAAYQAAQKNGRKLFLCFELTNAEQQTQFEQQVLASPNISNQLHHYELAVLPTSTTVPQSEQPLLDHSAFRFMYRQAGIGILDLSNAQSPHYGHLISAHPFSSNRTYSADEIQTVLNLPDGTITQRTLIYALRRHPERPQSAFAAAHPYLLSMSNQHSVTMARLHQVGHHNWNTRFHQINSAVGGAASEVAVGGNGYTLLEAANSCIRIWRSSPGHWNSMRRSHRYFGYDMVQAGNGTWYATGIFVD